MKRVLLFTTLLLAVAVFASCDKDGSNAKVNFRKANIANANMLALASGQTATRAEGDIKIGPKALYTVSADGTMVEVTYQVDVEGVDGEVAETIQANLIISPGFVFPVGEGWLWLANCHYDVKGGWANYPKDNSDARHALSNIINDFSDKYGERHGAHYLIRKSDGALFEWTLEAGAPFGMDDGFKQPTFLNGWFHQFGKDLFVKAGGWSNSGMSDPNVPSLIRLEDKGSTLDAVNLLGNNINCWSIYPATNCLGAALSYSSGAAALGILVPPTFMPPVLMQEGGDKDMFLMSIGGTLYLGVNTTVTVTVNDGKDNYEQTRDVTEVYNLDITSNSIARGSKICTTEPQIFSGDGRAIISTGETLTWWTGNEYDGAKVNTLNPKTGVVTSRSLPAHYPSREDEYVNGVAYVANGTTSYYECDLSKDAAEEVQLDWSEVTEYQGQMVPNSLRLIRFEAASMMLQFIASLSDGTELSLYASVTGADRGKVKATVGSANNAGLVVTTMVRLN